MRVFYIFKLNKDFCMISKRKPFNIFIIFSTIYYSNINDIDKVIDLFNKVIVPVNKDFLNIFVKNKLINSEEYTIFKNIHMYSNYYTNEVSKMTINNSYITIKTNKKNNIFLKELSYINNLFLCDFVNKEYILLNKKYIPCKNKSNLV